VIVLVNENNALEAFTFTVVQAVGRLGGNIVHKFNEDNQCHLHFRQKIKLKIK
jgi:hypothetical protein